MANPAAAAAAAAAVAVAAEVALVLEFPVVMTLVTVTPALGVPLRAETLRGDDLNVNTAIGRPDDVLTLDDPPPENAPNAPGPTAPTAPADADDDDEEDDDDDDDEDEDDAGVVARGVVAVMICSVD